MTNGTIRVLFAVTFCIHLFLNNFVEIHFTHFYNLAILNAQFLLNLPNDATITRNQF